MVTLLVVLGIAAAAGLLAGAARNESHRHVVVDGVPLDEVRPSVRATEARRPGVVVAHGYAGSARLMAPFADTLVAQGYVVVLLDFAGHGASTRALPDVGDRSDDASTVLQHDLDVALTHLRSLPDVDPARVAVVGHSMGATAVTRYAAAHPDVTATVAISLPDASFVTPERPHRLLVMVGGLEFAGFRAAAEQAVPPGVRGRSFVVVPGVEHVSVLYAPRTHREAATWLNDSFGETGGGVAPPSPLRRPAAAGLLLLSLLAGMYPLAYLLFGAPSVRGSTGTPPITRIVAVAGVASIVGMLLAPFLPTVRLPLAIGGYVVGFTATTGLVMLAWAHRRRAAPPVEASVGGEVANPVGGLGRWRLIVAGTVLIPYSAATIVIPLQLALTHAVPVGKRWWLAVFVWVGLAVLAYAAERTAAGNRLGVLAVSAVAVVALTAAAIVGLTSSFVLLVVPLLAVLMLGQAIWSDVLHRFSAPAGLIAVVGSLLVAWPVAVALPVIG